MLFLTLKYPGYSGGEILSVLQTNSHWRKKNPQEMVTTLNEEVKPLLSNFIFFVWLKAEI